MRGNLATPTLKSSAEPTASRIPGQSDFCCYWFEKARELIEHGKCKRAGLLATQGIRGGANREVLKRIKETGDIFFAESDRDWILDGANVHVSMVGFDDGERNRHDMLDGKTVEAINAKPNCDADVRHRAARASGKRVIGFIGVPEGSVRHAEEQALDWLLRSEPTRQAEL